ncbi:MAG: hypothetical protein WKF89_18280 [Chitinophagaceae bacterium]
MKQSNVSSLGGLQPFLFCIGMSFVALTFSVFICFSIFYVAQSANPSMSKNKASQQSENVIQKQSLALTSLN